MFNEIINGNVKPDTKNLICIKHLINESNYSLVIEALGDDEKGTDILVTRFDGTKEHQQCKARNASKEYWEMSDLKAQNIFKNCYFQLNRGAM